ncbi:MAG: carbohydrate porin [Pseudomonadota bacterium]|nr:carbohydrate porin [Pseudomonadota bacterium]
MIDPIRTRLAGVLIVCGALAVSPSRAQTNSDPGQSPASPEPVPAAPVTTPMEETTTGGGLMQRDKLLGTFGGVRPVLEAHGIVLTLSETSEVLGNPTGGRATGVIYEGATNASLDIDMEKAVGVSGGTMRISALQIHGRGLSTNYVGNLNVVSSVEATRSSRLYEIWYQQMLFEGKADIRVGQQSADLEFALTSYGGLFTNSSFGWSSLFSVSLPGGGSAYPLGVLGARMRLRPREDTTILLGVFNGNPARPGTNDPQLRDAQGTSFRLNDGYFAIGEVQYAINGGEKATGLAGTYKLGGWYHSRAFTNQFFVSTLGIASNNTGSPGRPNDDWILYGVADKLVWSAPGTKDGGVGVFARVMGGPGSRNQINVFANAGATYKGVFGRENDTVGLGLAWARISDTARANDAALAAASPLGFSPIRSSEVTLELTYQAQVSPWLTLQPVAQYVFNPGGGVVNPGRPDRRVGDAAVFGIRTVVAF